MRETLATDLNWGSLATRYTRAAPARTRGQPACEFIAGLAAFVAKNSPGSAMGTMAQVAAEHEVIADESLPKVPNNSPFEANTWGGGELFARFCPNVLADNRMRQNLRGE